MMALISTEMKQTSSMARLIDIPTATIERQRQYDENMKYVLGMQPIAITQFYNNVWPDYKVVELDNDRADHLKTILDVGGADKMLRAQNGAIAFLAQRFRRYKSWHPTPSLIYDDFTLRYSFPNGHDSEMEKLQQAMIRGGFVATWYAYGHANQYDTGFDRFRIIQLPLLLQYLDSGQIKYKRRLNVDKRPFACIPFQSMPRQVFLLDYPSYQLTMFNNEQKLNSSE